MRHIRWPQNTAEIIDEIRSVIGRLVVLNVEVGKTSCPNPECHLDPITNTSDNSFCPVCHGDYFIPVVSGFPVSGVVFWGKMDRLRWLTGGQIFEGDCTIQVKYSPENEELVRKARNALVDGRTVEIKSIEKRGVQGINRIILYCKEADYGNQSGD